MTDEMKLKTAQNVYNTLCAMMDEKKFRYQKHVEDLVITFTMNGDDIPMDFIVNIDAKRQLVRVLSSIPVVFGETKRIEGAIATSQVNYSLADGSFDFDFKNGKVLFRMTACFLDSLVTKELFEYMLSIACHTVDEFNDKFLMLAKGHLPLEEFFKD